MPKETNRPPNPRDIFVAVKLPAGTPFARIIYRLLRNLRSSKKREDFYVLQLWMSDAQ